MILLGNSPQRKLGVAIDETRVLPHSQNDFIEIAVAG